MNFGKVIFANWSECLLSKCSLIGANFRENIWDSRVIWPKWATQQKLNSNIVARLILFFQG